MSYGSVWALLAIDYLRLTECVMIWRSPVAMAAVRRTPESLAELLRDQLRHLTTGKWLQSGPPWLAAESSAG